MVFVLTTVSAVSWAAMFVGAFAEALFETPYTLNQMEAVYLALLVAAAIAGLCIGKIRSLRARGTLGDYLPFDLMGESAH